MFWKRKDKNEGDENSCPFCGVSNAADATTCIQCYYDLTKPPRDQHNAVETSVKNNLLSTLMDDADEEGEEEYSVEAVLNLEDVTVDIEQYDDAEDSDNFSFIESEGPTLSETVEFEKAEEVELSTDDAPEIEERFTVPESNPLDEVEEPIHTGQGQLFSETASEESEVDFTGTVGPDPGMIPDLPDMDDEPEMEPTAIPDLPIIEEDIVPEFPEEDGVEVQQTPELPIEEDSVPELPDDAIVESSNEEPTEEDVVTPEPQLGHRIWPWPAAAPYDQRDVHRIVVESLTLVKSGRVQEAEAQIDALGPHLGDDVSLLYHIGLILQQAGRTEHLNWMLEMARRVHSDNENVTTAIAHLSA
tara:strand:+ start:3397 stop:4473 length:1077 start_codon:yes stop_codon:yes gene_type:complete